MLSCHDGCGPVCGCTVEDQFCVFGSGGSVDHCCFVCWCCTVQLHGRWCVLVHYTGAVSRSQCVDVGTMVVARRKGPGIVKW